MSTANQKTTAKTSTIQENDNQEEAQQQTTKTVVIVGASFAGLACLGELSQNHSDHRLRIILIDQKEYFEYTPGVLRLFCDPTLFPTMARKLPTGTAFRVLQGRVTAIVDSNGQKVLTYQTVPDRQRQQQRATLVLSTEDGISNCTERLRYDYLVIATGSTYPGAITPSIHECTLQDRQASWYAAHERLMSAKTVLILGGGAVGVELAAEIAHYFPSSNNNNNKHVTIVDASPNLVPLFPKATGDYAHRWLLNHGVALRLGQMLESWNETSCTLKDGTVLKADLVYVCFGDRPNSSPMVSLDTTASRITDPVVPLDRRKCAMVNEMLQATVSITGSSSVDGIFCCGDVAAPPRGAEKQAFQAEVQGIVAGRNVLRHLAGNEALLTYPDGIAGLDQMPLIFVLSLGRYDGMLGFNSICIPGPLAAIVKWILEYTKVMHMAGRPLGKLIWKIGDAVVLFLSRTLIKPPSK
jgi:NADH dehydrogenase FAD-containing subunit